ncbi:MAG: carboxypeptidase-like regulatory domain-containing protein [Bacteroidales bacterium]|jgi:hypothetical protein|nr:carboxypeptidase-like regulatory domain-containing protein [Bacteroidales bacterium]
MKTYIFCLLLLGAFTVHAQDYLTVSGTVKDRITKKPVEYVTISVTDRNTSTVTNADGFFSLKIPLSEHAAFVDCSHIGYYNFRIPVKDEDVALADIFLIPSAIAIDAVTVYGWEADHLVREAIKKIGDNYASQPNRLTGFYRETIRKKRNYTNITEAVIDLYKTAYTESVEQDKVQIIKGRKLLSAKKSDTLAVKLLGGPAMSVFVDIVKNPDVLLDAEMLDAFLFKIEDIMQINERDQYVVTFVPRMVLPYPLYAGAFYIDKETLAFTRAEFHLDLTDLEKATGVILKKKPLGLRFRPDNVSYIVSYREHNDKTYLSYICNELQFKCDWKKKLFATNYTVVSEMVVTDVREQDVTAIPRKTAFRTDQSLSEKVSDFYDENFWGAYNIIEPTESLDAAIDKLKKRQ